MIGAIYPGRFKCFQGERFELRRLTLLTGVNGAGKSSLVQSLLLMKQAVNTQSTYVRLNGVDMLRLGQALDVVLGEESLELAVEDEGGKRRTFRFHASNEESLNLSIVPPEHSQDDEPSFPELHQENFVYLNAERIGPRELFDADSSPEEALTVGAQGEYVAQVLQRRGDTFRVLPDLCHPSTDRENAGPTLLKQTELWMRDLIPDLEIRALTLPGVTAAALRFKKRGPHDDWVRPANMGFGVSYTLPIIVAGLLAMPGHLLVIENPEAHLHPQGQSRIGRFLALLAAKGIQVLVETHSDHVLNGIRLAATDEHPLRPEDVLIHFFSGRRQDNVAIAEAITVTRRGSLSAWPLGFFDQSERDLAAIIRGRRNG